MSEKQGKEDFEFIKDDKDSTGKYLLKNNRITLIAIGIIVFFLIIILVGIFLSGDSLM